MRLKQSQDARKGAAFLVSLPQDVDDAEVTEKPLPIYETHLRWVLLIQMTYKTSRTNN